MGWLMSENFPAVYTDLGLRTEGRLVIAGSLAVAKMYGKRHDNVLRDIDDHLARTSDLRSRNWFRETTYTDERGRTRRAVDMTRSGFTFLTHKWTGDLPNKFTIAYIDAFDALEKALNEGAPVTGTELIQAVREIVAPLAVRFEGQDLAIGRLEKGQEELKTEVGNVKAEVIQLKAFFQGKRKDASPENSEAYKTVAHVVYLGLCPCGCGIRILDEKGNRLSNYHEDHFYARHRNGLFEMWPVADSCNYAMDNPEYRAKKQSRFEVFKEELKKLFPLGPSKKFPPKKGSTPTIIQPGQPTFF